MTIDIITFTEEQYAKLTEAQLIEVTEAQVKKDRLTQKLETELQKIKGDLINNGIYNSTVYALLEAEKHAAYEKEVELVREMLLFYLRYSMRPESMGTTQAPYDVNYALSDEERFQIVKKYYETTYNNGAERFSAFKADEIAPSYLGELYAPLYDYFMGFA